MPDPAEPAVTSIVMRPRSPRLAPFVSSIGYLEGTFEHRRERSLPSGTMQLLVNLDADQLHSYDDRDGDAVQCTGGAVLQGPSARPSVIDPAEQRSILWVGFRLGGAYPFFPAMAETTDQLVDLGEFWGRDGAVLRERLLEARTPIEKLRTVEAVLLARAARPLERDPAIAYAARALHGGASVGEVSDRLGWTSKRLGRGFVAQVGLAPKRFARLRRFQRALHSAVTGDPGTDWSRVAADCGYHDQSHLIHEFREFAGMTPTGYAPRSLGELNHVPLPD